MTLPQAIPIPGFPLFQLPLTDLRHWGHEDKTCDMNGVIEKSDVRDLGTLQSVSGGVLMYLV